MNRCLTVTLSMLLGLVFAFDAFAGPVEVKLQVVETEKVARNPAVVTTGVPFARGQVKDVGKLTVAVGGKPVPAQFIAISPWDDGSVRWALMDVQVPVAAGGKVELVVTDGGGNPAPATPVKITDAADGVSVSTGPLQFTVSKKKFNLFESLKVDGKELITSAGKGLVVLKTDGTEVLAGPTAEVKIEQAGEGSPMRAIVCVKGKFPGVHNDLLSYTARITAFAGSKAVKVHVWLENGGAYGWAYGDSKGAPAAQPMPEWFAFRGMAVDLGLGLGPKTVARCEGAESADGLKVLQTCRPFAPRSDKRSPGRPFYTWDDFAYTITSQGKELKKGDRTDGLVELKGETGAASLAVAVGGFWQNYEKAIEAAPDGSSLKIWLWPTEGRWPRIRPDQREAELGQALGRADWAGAKLGPYYYLPGGTHKGHEFILDFSGGSRDAKETGAELSAPLMALASADYYAATEAAPGLFAPPATVTGDSDCDAKLASWLRMAKSTIDPNSPAGIPKARQSSLAFDVGYTQEYSLWFGWMDFGDLSVAGHGQVGLHYDWPWVMATNAMRTGDPRFLQMGCQMVRHKIDIDQGWSDRDLPELASLQHPDRGCPSYHCSSLRSLPSVSSNWLAGLVSYYMLTGEPKVLEAIQRNAAGVKAGWEWVARRRPYNGPQTDMADNAWSMSAYCAMFKLTGEKKWLDAAVDLFKRHVVPKWQDLGPFLHDARHQIVQQDYIQEDMKYCYALAAFCELHHLTGDETVFKLLTEGCQKKFPDNTFFEAPLFLSDLFAYVGYKSKNADYLKKAADLFAQTFPESKCPPVWLADSSTWSRTAAMTLRTGHIMQYATWKSKQP